MSAINTNLVTSRENRLLPIIITNHSNKTIRLRSGAIVAKLSCNYDIELINEAIEQDVNPIKEGVNGSRVAYHDINQVASLNLEEVITPDKHRDKMTGLINAN